MSLPPTVVEALVEAALAEDLRSGDVTSMALLPPGAAGTADLVAREALVVAGIDVARAVFLRLDPHVRFEALAHDGEAVEPGPVARVSGNLRAMLAAERTALNVMQRACGIATMTRRCVEAVAGTGAAILATRKTAPGLRALDKHAVRCGGGMPHRQALDDMILVKDNHVAAVGSVEEAVRRALAFAGHALRVQVEVDSLEALDRILELDALPDSVLLDNFQPREVAEGVRRVAGRMFVEVSGGIGPDNLRTYAEAGPDGISLGALTHSVRAADLALDLRT